MKKIKLFLLAAMIVGAGSAFTTTKATEELYVLDEDGISFITETEALGKDGSCESFENEKCTYTSPGVPNPAGEDGRYQY